jgi:5-formyltetrahydrofolate cyclo-ligase
VVINKEPVVTTKNDIRKAQRQWRQSLSVSDRGVRSKRICKNIGYYIGSARCILACLPFDNEANRKRVSTFFRQPLMHSRSSARENM